jgi:hypothetical protein
MNRTWNGFVSGGGLVVTFLDPSTKTKQSARMPRALVLNLLVKVSTTKMIIDIRMLQRRDTIMLLFGMELLT